MKYFLDTEFIEGRLKPVIGKERHFIDLISIGIVKENGKSYYAVSKEFDASLANDWVKENVLNKLGPRIREGDGAWKTNEEIARDIISFVGTDQAPEFYGYFADYDWVLFASLFGTMMDLPGNFPMYCKDIEQIRDGFKIDKETFLKDNPQKDEHNALSDAKWNLKAYKYLKAIKEQINDTKP